MKGIILAGGAGTRLHPLTKVVSKQLLPIFDKPMIYYPLSTLISSGIKEILIISTPEDLPLYKKLLGSGEKYGLRFAYKVQPKPNGLAQAFILGDEFIGEDSVCLILGDNIFVGNNIHSKVISSFNIANDQNKASIFGYKVLDPERYGVAEFDKNFNIKSIEEKPTKPKSNYAVVGLYIYPNNVLKKVQGLTPSSRGEYEITSLNQKYLDENNLKIQILKDDFFWLDTGTHSSLIEASNFIATLENRTNKKIGCIEEIVFNKKYIEKKDLKEIIKELGNNEYSNYLKDLL